MLKLCHNVSSQHIQDFLEVFFMFFQYKMWYLVSASLVMPIGDPGDRFFYFTLTLMMDSYNFTYPYQPAGKIKMNSHTSVARKPRDANW